ncbi:MAG: 3'(2'),5'-bisphosphate nucleotidase CysQ [Byssovorax sp.]
MASPSSLARELDVALATARRASALILEIYATPFTVELKGPDDPVTRADREANTLICEALAAAFPGDAIVAEESAPETPAETSALVLRERVWFVDPIDGTREFADRNGEFAVMIGLAIKGRAALGVVLMPTLGQALAGIVGGEAFCEDASGARRPLRVTTVQDPREATMMVSRSHRPRIVEPVIERLGIHKTVSCGSVGVKVARIALGEADLYVHGGRGAKRWDSCAPEAILLAAGGRFTDIEGELIDYAAADLMLDNGLVASNGALHDTVLAVTSIFEG